MAAPATETNEPPSRSRDPAIDWMRALAIIYIAGFWHLNNYTQALPWYHSEPFARLTVLALALFVLISGFLAGKAGQRLTARGLANYYGRKLIRIYPPYLAALMVFTVMKLSGADFVLCALMLNMIIPPPPHTLWFMTMIVLFYLVAPFLLASASKPARLVLVMALSWFVLLVLDRTILNLEDRLLIYLPAFGAGILIGNIRRTRHALLVGSGLIAFTGYMLSLRAPTLDPDQSLWMVPWATSSAAFVFVLLRGRLPRSWIIEELSLGGFFLYLFHRPIYVALLKTTGMQTPWAREALLVCIGLPLAIGFGIVGQRSYDALIAQIMHVRSNVRARMRP